MQLVLVRTVRRRNPFSLEKLPVLARLYRHPFEKFKTLGRIALFGAPNFAVFFLWRRLFPFGGRGVFKLALPGGERHIQFNARNTQFSALYFSCFKDGYEVHVNAVLDALLPDDGVFVDVGSNWGWFPLYVASRPGFRGSVHAFEPFPATFADLASVVAQAGLNDRIQCHAVALSDKSGRATMQLPDGFQSGLAMMSEENAGPGKGVATDTLDALELGSVSVIKIDAEGAELKVLRGAAATIAKHRPMIVLESGRRFEQPELTLGPLRRLRELGYVFFNLGWLRADDGHPYLLGDDHYLEMQPEEKLCLVQFEVEERFQRQDGMNLLACHRDRLAELEKLFTRWQPPA